MSEEGQPPEAGPEDLPDKPVEGAAPAIYDGPIEKFKGKTVDEIAQVYGDLESSYGKKDAEIKAQAEKLAGYEQWYRNQQQQQPVQQQPPQAPPDIYDNPQAFVQQAAQPLIQGAVEQANLRNAVNGAKRVLFSAKQMYPGAFDGVDDDKVLGIMMNGVKTGTTHYSILESEDAMKMAAWQMKGEETGYKPSGPNPVSPTQSEQPSGGSHGSEPPSMPKDAGGWAEAMGKDSKKAQEIWDATIKAREKK